MIEAQGLRDRARKIAAAGAEIVGASFDTPEENAAFADSEGLLFPLVSDVDHSVGEQYQVTREPSDPWFSVPRRITYLIDPEGTIAKAYNVKDIHAHLDEVVEDLAALAASR